MCFRARRSSIARGALNLDPRAHIRYGALPSIAPAIWRYYAASTPAGKNATARAMAPLARRGQRRAPRVRARRRAPRLCCVAAAGSRRSAARAGRSWRKEAEELKPLRHQADAARPGRPDRARAARRAKRRSAARITPIRCRRPIPRRSPRATPRCSSSAAGAWRRATRGASSPRAAAGWSRPTPAGSPPATS